MRQRSMMVILVAMVCTVALAQTPDAKAAAKLRQTLIESERKLLAERQPLVFQPQFVARGLALAVAPPASAASMPATFKPLRHKRCKSTNCTITVTYGNPSSANNDCGVDVDDVWFLKRGVRKITWELKPAAGYGGARMRFRFGTGGERLGINHADNNDNPNELGVLPPLCSAPPCRMFEIAAQTDTSHSELVHASRDKLRKVFYYAIELQKINESGEPGACNPYDPVIVTRGD
jgi:hypothetical protein